MHYLYVLDPPIYSQDLIFFEPAMETLSDMANDDDELPKGWTLRAWVQVP